MGLGEYRGVLEGVLGKLGFGRGMKMALVMVMGCKRRDIG